MPNDPSSPPHAQAGQSLDGFSADQRSPHTPDNNPKHAENLSRDASPNLAEAQPSSQPSRRTPQSSPSSHAIADEDEDIPIDPSLMDESGGLQNARPLPPTSLLPVDGARGPQGQDSPAGHRFLPWTLQTDIASSSGPTTVSSSPATPGLGIDGLYHGKGWDTSRRSSVSTFDTPIGASYGLSTRASSESGLDEPLPAAHNVVDKNGVPPPRPKKSHARKQPEGHIKRARNAFILFRKHITDSNLIPPSVEVKHQNISVVAAKMWREAPQEVRQKFQEQARLEKEEHQRKYPGYRYQPVFRRTDIIRRRVRKDPAEDDKVEAVAEALIKGKAGTELEREITDQMVARSEGSSSDHEGSRSGGRRRRREVGQLSKGAIRAQRAQARAKQMRQNLLGANLLNISLYNAAAQRGGIPNHPGAQHHLQYAKAENYLPVSYDAEAQPMSYDAAGIYGAPEMDSNDMYRLPPINNMGLTYDPSGQGGTQDRADYWQMSDPSGVEYDMYGSTSLHNDQADYPSFLNYDPMAPVGNEQYQLPPLINPHAQHHQTQGSDSHTPPVQTSRVDPRMHEWARDGQQTPSGHVMFNERLFDGALGSASLPALGEGQRDADLAGFDEAIAQANEISHW